LQVGAGVVLGPNVDRDFKGWKKERGAVFGHLSLDSVLGYRVYYAFSGKKSGTRRRETFMRAAARVFDSEVREGDRGVRSLKIGEVSKLSGIGIEALRFYEKGGLLDRPTRTASGYRVYGRDVLERLAFIKRAQMLGFTLDEIKQIIVEKRAGQSPCRNVREVVRRRLDELDERMREMRRYRNELAKALKEWDEAGEKKGHICGLIEGTDIEHMVETDRRIKRRS
jgi:DNA-binding transcriptional MerR regulator